MHIAHECGYNCRFVSGRSSEFYAHRTRMWVQLQVRVWEIQRVLCTSHPNVVATTASCLGDPASFMQNAPECGYNYRFVSGRSSEFYAHRIRMWLQLQVRVMGDPASFCTSHPNVVTTTASCLGDPASSMQIAPECGYNYSFVPGIYIYISVPRNLHGIPYSRHVISKTSLRS
jgi:hypothetical protein